MVTNLNAFFDPAGTFLTSSATRVDGATSPLILDRAYVAIKAGLITAYIFNTAGVSQELTYVGRPAGGLSNNTFIGALGDTPVGPPSNPPTPAVPLPAGIVLLLGALGGLGLLRRKA